MAGEVVRIAVAIALIAAAWLIPRRVAGARIRVSPAVLLDVLPFVVAGGLLLIATGRPLFTGLALLGLGGGFALADHAKRTTLREPVVFSDMSELRHVFTHPHLYLPFAGPLPVVGGAVATAGIAVALLVFGAPLWEPHPWEALGLFIAVSAAGWLLSRAPALGWAAALMRRLRPTGEPFADAARLGPFAVLLAYGTIARAERSARRAEYQSLPAPALAHGAALPVVLVQCESFFDARRLSPLIPPDLLPGFDACRQRGGISGRFEVPAWGANTMRAEFAVLTGIAEDRLGYDRFNPYHAFAREPLASLASWLRAQGYRTICLHPFDRGFFGRDRILRALGFDEFLGRERLGGGRRPPYRSDPDHARDAVRVLEAAGPRSFVFVITMGNHGPWQAAGPEIDPVLRHQFDAAELPQGASLLRYLDGLVHSDRMLQILLEELAPDRGHTLFGFYGDHLPSLPWAFDHFGFSDWASDYVVVDGSERRRRADLPAYGLPWMILDRLQERGAIARAPVRVLGAA